MIVIDHTIRPESLSSKWDRVFDLSGRKIDQINKDFTPETGTPVFTEKGKYTSQGWTEWTQGFQFGSEILQYDATNDRKYLDSGREHTIKYMASHVSHTGVHDHGLRSRLQ
jgi:hypothetical protein